jgi:tetratricopeptide (TPR) repeat protein
MSPEQTRGDGREIDLRSDVYALGVILYETITGGFPYDTQAVSLVGALRAIVEAPPRPLAQAFQGDFKLDPDLQTIVGKTLEKEPDQRYASAAALADDVERYLADQPILAHPPSTAYQIRKLVSRHRASFVVAAGVLVLLVGAAIALAVQDQKIRRERDRAASEAARATAINQFLQKTLGAADPWQRGSRGVSLVDALKQGEKQIHGSFASQPAAEADVLEAVGRTYTGLGQFEDAERLLRSSLRLRIATVGKDADAYAQTLAALGEPLRDQKRFDEAEKIFREVLEIRRRRQGPESAEAAQAMDDLAVALAGKSALDEAERLTRDGLKIRERLFGAQSVEVARSLATLNSVLTEKTDFKGAAEVNRRRIAIWKAQPQENVDLYIAMGDLGVDYLSMEDNASAEKLLSESAAAATRLLGEDHPETASALENLGNVWYQQGRREEAAKTLERIIAIRTRVFGADSEPVARSTANLATVYWASKNFEAAIPKFDEAIEKLSRFLGPDHPDVATTMLTMSSALVRVGRRLDDADTIAAAGARLRVGQVLVAKKRYAEADEFFRQAADVYFAKSDITNPNARSTVQSRIDLYKAWGKPAEAKAQEAFLADAVAKAEKK